MDHVFTVAAPPAAVWPWLVQLGKKRAGWYLPAAAERFLPPGRRAARDSPAPACTCGCAWGRCGARGWRGQQASSSMR